MTVDKIFQEVGQLHLKIVELQEEIAALKVELAASKSVPPAPAKTRLELLDLAYKE